MKPSPTQRDTTAERKRLRRALARPGSVWRVLAHRADGTTVEIHDDGVFDELAVFPWLHIEQMSERQWWMQVGDAAIWIDLPRRGELIVTVERGVYCRCQKRPCKHKRAGQP